MRYCSSDAFVGDAGASDRSNGWHFRGQVRDTAWSVPRKLAEARCLFAVDNAWGMGKERSSHRRSARIRRLARISDLGNGVHVDRGDCGVQAIVRAVLQEMTRAHGLAYGE